MKGLFTGIMLLTLSSFAVADIQKLAIHVSDDSPKTMNLALNNAQNVRAFYEAQGDEVKIEVVAYGPGLKMYMEDSPVKARLETLAMEDEIYQFSACGNTLNNMSKKSGVEIKLLEQSTIVPSGVVRLMELQGQGYAYLRP